MKYILVVLSFFIFACSSKPVDQASNADLPQPPRQKLPLNQRQLASEEEYLGSSYATFFGDENYMNRLVKVRKLVRQLHFLMEEKGHPRKKILKKFQNDLDKQITFLERVETNQNSTVKSWLPETNTYQYSAKVRALRAVKESGDVMAQLESYLTATKVLEDDNYEQNFYYNLMRKALSNLAEELQKREGPEQKGVQQAQFSYVDYLSSEARRRLRKVFTEKKDRPTEKRVNLFFRQLQQVKTNAEARSLISSAEMGFAESALANADYTLSSDIEGARDDRDTKISTYFGLEMIKYLYGQLN